jgi:AsmA protein
MAGGRACYYLPGVAAPRSPAKKIALALGALAGAVVLLLVLLLVLVDSGVVTKRAVDLVLPKVSAALGREVTLDGAELSLFPDTRVRLAGLTVAGRSGEPALLRAESLDVEIGLWPLVRSLGKEIEVRAFRLSKPAVNLVKAKDGTWNFEGLGGASPAGAEPSRPPAPPPAADGSGGARVAVGLVKIEQAAIQVVDRTLGKDDPALALTQLDLEATGVGPGLPLEAKLAAAFADRKQNLSAQLSVARLPAAIPQRPEDWPEVQGTLKLAALALDRIHALLPGDVGAIVRGGSASLDAKLSTATGAYRVDGTGDLRDVRLRGQSSSGRFRAVATWSPAKPDAARIEISDLALRGPGVDLGGTATVVTAPMQATFALAGPLLDLDAIMGILPEGAGAKAQPAAGAGQPEGQLVPEATRREIQAASARGTIAVDKLRGGRLEATGVKARATLSRGTLTLDELSAAVFGGRVSAAGTTVSLAEEIPSWKLAAALEGLDLEQAMTAFAGHAPLLGKVTGTLEVNGKGTQWEELRKGLAGLAALAIRDGTLTTTDLGAQVLGGVAQGLEALGRGGAAKKVGGLAGTTSFRDLAGKFTVKDGFLGAQSPFQLATPAGDVALGGRIGLDGRLDLQGTTVVPRKVLAEAISSSRLPEKLEVPLALGGTLTSPRVSVRADRAVESLVKAEGKAAAQDLRRKAEQEGKKRLEGVLDRFKR